MTLINEEMGMNKKEFGMEGLEGKEKIANVNDIEYDDT